MGKDAAAPDLEEPNIKPNPFEEDEPPEAPTLQAPTRGRTTKRIRVRDLKPNAINGTLWSESLADESIESLGADLDRHDLRQLIEINENDEILDGERRWRTLMKKAPDREVEVVVVPNTTAPQEVEEYILDAYSSVRDASMAERVNLYDLARSVLKRRHGRGRGRPKVTTSDEAVFWSEKEVKAEAAKRAGFGSAETARRASKVMREGGPELRASLVAGDVTINAAYRALTEDAEEDDESEQASEVIVDESDLLSVEAAEAASAGESDERESSAAPEEGGDEVEVESSEGRPSVTAHATDNADNERFVEEDELDDVEPADDVDAEYIWESLGDVRTALNGQLRIAARTDRSRAIRWCRVLVEECRGVLREARKAS